MEGKINFDYGRDLLSSKLKYIRFRVTNDESETNWNDQLEPMNYLKVIFRTKCSLHWRRKSLNEFHFSKSLFIEQDFKYSAGNILTGVFILAVLILYEISAEFSIVVVLEGMSLSIIILPINFYLINPTRILSLISKPIPHKKLFFRGIFFFFFHFKIKFCLASRRNFCV